MPRPVTQADVGHVIGLLTTAHAQTGQNRANILRSISNVAGSRACCEANGLAQRLLDTGGDSRAVRNLETIALEAYQNSQYNPPGFEQRWFTLAAGAKDSVQAMASMTPQQSSAAARPIEQRQDRLATRIRQLRGQVGGSMSVSGAFNPMSTQETATEFAAISRLINQTDMLESDKQRLRSRNRAILKDHGEFTSAVQKSGQDISNALDTINNALKAEGCDLLDWGCYWDLYKWRIILGVGGTLALVILLYGFASGMGRGMIGLRKR